MRSFYLKAFFSLAIICLITFSTACNNVSAGDILEIPEPENNQTIIVSIPPLNEETVPAADIDEFPIIENSDIEDESLQNIYTDVNNSNNENIVTSVPSTYVAEVEFITTAEVSNPKKDTQLYTLPNEFYSELETLTYKYPQFSEYDISFVYEDIESGFSVQYNPDKHYYIASVIKAPYAMYIYRKALAGEIDLEQTVIYTPSFKKDGTGVIQNMEFGQEFTIDELIKYAIEWSDNSAYAMLRSVIPEAEYIEYTKTIGVTHSQDLQIKNIEKICTESAISYGNALYQFFEEHNLYSDRLKEYMLSTRNAMIYANAPVVRKYGWYEGYFLDLAVVYSQRPYVISIMGNFIHESDKNNDENTEETGGAGASEFALYKELSLLIDKYSNMLIPVSIVDSDVSDENSNKVILTLNDVQHKYNNNDVSSQTIIELFEDSNKNTDDIYDADEINNINIIQKSNDSEITEPEFILENSEEVIEMAVPNDPVILLSYVNTMLRDNYDSFSLLCDNLDVDSADVSQKLLTIGYIYNSEINQFVS